MGTVLIFKPGRMRMCCPWVWTAPGSLASIWLSSAQKRHYIWANTDAANLEVGRSLHPE